MSKLDENPKKNEAMKTVPPNLLPVYEQLVNEYMQFCVDRYGRPFVSYIILADLINAGWRPTHDPFVKSE